MPGLLLSLAKWLFGKGIGIAFAVVLAVGALAFWLYARDSFRDESLRAGQLADLQAQAREAYSELEDIHGRLIKLGEDIEKTRERMRVAEQAISTLTGIIGRIERWLTLSPEERRETERKLEEARQTREAQQLRLDRLTREQSLLRLDRAVLVEKTRMLEQGIEELEARSSEFVQYVETAWSRLKPYVIGAMLVLVFAPILWKLVAYYLFAPLVASARPMRFESEPLPLPQLRDSGVSAQIALGQGERIWVKESYLQASDETLKRRTRFVLNWSIPFTCVAAGLIEMIELRGETEPGKVTVSPQKRAEIEVASIEVPEGGKLIARPSCVAAVVTGEDRPAIVKRRWRFMHPQAWLTLQFRYFVFEGPCKLVVTGVRGVRVEVLDTGSEKGRRSNQIATIGFTPDLGYGAARAETFWSYFRGFNPLFDDVFRGRGLFLCQEITEKELHPVTRFWAGAWNAALKILGI